MVGGGGGGGWGVKKLVTFCGRYKWMTPKVIDRDLRSSTNSGRPFREH